MILDSETQKENLLNLCKIALVNGTYEQVSPIVKAIGELREQIMRAQVISPAELAVLMEPAAEKKGA